MLGLGLFLTFRGFFPREKQSNWARRFAKQIGVQASGDARALRHRVGFVMSLSLLVWLLANQTGRDH